MGNYFLTSAADVVNQNAQVPENLGERLIYGLQVSLIGIGMVFLVLMILMAVIYIFRLVFYTIPNRKKQTAAVVQPEVPATPEPVVAEAEDGDEIAAVISAVLAAYAGQSQAQAHKKYQIKSFRRID